ncbi:DUF4145 domain-containing protein [Halomonas sp. GD1P12]|uniref:DUF4145 domain-containing protein n=1 Tax=Halomonas sp. GD1P12 TaxID=2982691 RepID=UPI0021E3B747|nr:DUF4145 domain-containing protein [Halomonas sp. GD1P12]UYF99354.1 DUF4145 domain-containing protein [Halomonas sp. GD1P12]
MKYYPPKHRAKSFTCPFCDVYSKVAWFNWQLNQVRTLVERAQCQHCGGATLWFGTEYRELSGQLIFPLISGAPFPHQDMPEDAKKDYLEARDVLPHSSRAAAALLRLALQRLCIHLGKNSKIDRAIGELVQDGLPQAVQKALDAIRIIGNESVHPGELKDEDIDKSVGSMFELLNFIVQDRITRFKEIDALYESLPEGKRQGVEKRDSSN